MTSARLNFTQRVKIPTTAVVIRADASQTPPTMSATFNLDGLGLEEHQGASIIVEASVQSRLMRFPAGRIGSPFPVNNALLTDFVDCSGMVFRLKVIEESEQRILAVADRISPELTGQDGGSESLLPVRSSPDLGEVAWKLDISDDTPALVINSNLGDKETVVSSPGFAAFVFPEVIRQIALWVIDYRPDVDDTEDICGAWLKLLDDLGADANELPGEDASFHERIEWSDLAVRGFSSSHRLASALAGHLSGEES